ncbi:MAG: hypothetical protein A2474_02190 [Elusimicrobia bacterium RIFOXYC2_FULL_34_12]|nr:MAG: hypothetical protein A2474_02190 [Elusimicrobia bacterium RIFOXYC2_FULL_34_12]OGS38985.1 MAG: hypothetical protein A2551_06250 [Elusimicrobia bacterium RIFOXYD2_FULL_34_30]HAM38706.1 hypothetical protein [Elusimicrobiota bacterium]
MEGIVEKEVCESGSCSLTQEKMDFIKSNEALKTTKHHEFKTGIGIKIFSKKECDICKTTIEKLNIFLSKFSNKPNIIHYDFDTLDGLTEAAVNSAFDVPTILIEKDGVEIKRWGGNTLSLLDKEIENVCS